jgi:phage gp36-like protein
MTEQDLAAHISQREIDEFRLSQGFVDGMTPDPVKDLLLCASEEIRGACRAYPGIRLCPKQYTIPESLVATASEIVAYRLLKRMPLQIEITDARTNAYNQAMERLAKVATGAFLPESYNSTDLTNNRNIPLYGMVFRPRILR